MDENDLEAASITNKNVNDETNSNDKNCDDKLEIKYFQCEMCGLNEKYEYFGKSPSTCKEYKLTENSYIIEDPFLPPKQGEILVLGSHCVKCDKKVCKDINCSFYYDGTLCIRCAKDNRYSLPQTVQEKLNKIIGS